MTACQACTLRRAQSGRRASTKPALAAIASAPRAMRFARNWSRHAIGMPPRLQRKPASAPEHLADVPMLGNRHNAPLALAPAEALCLERPH